MVIASIFVFNSCEQARTLIVDFNCDLTHFYSRHTADRDNVVYYIKKKGAQQVGTSFRLSIYGKNDEVCTEEADRQARVYFDQCTCYFRESELEELLGEETEFEYSFWRTDNSGDTIIVANYKYNMD